MQCTTASASCSTPFAEDAATPPTRAFVEPVRHRRNLTVLTEAAVQRIVLKGNVATGVEAC